MAQVFLVDTNVLWNPPLCARLTSTIEAEMARVYIPALVHAERIRQVADHFGEQFSIHVVRQFLHDARFEVLPFTVEDAEAIADLWTELKENGYAEQSWKEHRFDIILCAVARSRGYVLVTDDGGLHFDRVHRWKTVELERWLRELEYLDP